ncbi:PucR family transcriptional regulator [Streptosporangium sp. NBC_01756]|uniref:PucR family transcriptional regulator n=1 Tax=Streptosporangium sp. NBC_01756 TaxID=2975950 RepID=UPI002DDC0011|nr:helix-turn-helix domain-containing protein [Streptosporangium sp. NBC_01756]WSC85230.1 helix-turn-helix domain-containing protein [Streptosporangium sp. NBC_01756]
MPNYVAPKEDEEIAFVDMTQKAQVLLAEIEEIAAVLVDTVWERLPGYDQARMEVEDLVETVTPNLTAMISAVAQRRGLAEGELLPAVELGRRRAIQGVPIESLVASWHAAERALVERLVVAGPPPKGQDLAEIVQRLAAVTDSMIDASTEAYRQTRSEAAAHLDQIATDLVSRLSGEEPLDPADVEERARLVGVPAQVPHRAAAIGVAGEVRPLALAKAQKTVLDSLRPRLRSRILAGSRGSTMLLVLADDAGLDEALARATRRPGLPHGLVVGLGEPRPRLGEAGASCREALAALEAGLRMGTDRTVVHFRCVIPEVLLISNPLDARRLADTVLTPLRPNLVLIETLRAYLSCGLSVRLTARHLSVHENTVSYRLRRILELLELDDASQLLRPDVILALRADELGEA